MKLFKISSVFLIFALMLAAFSGCSELTVPEDTAESSTGLLDGLGYGESGAFRPVDCGLAAQEVYEYPFLGLTVKLSENLLGKLRTHEVFAFTQEDYNNSNGISYAFIRFSSTTEEDRTQEVFTVDILAWEDALEKVGVIGVYEAALTARLDELTGCDCHEKLGESADGAYVYYLSTRAGADAMLTGELQSSEISISQMHELDFSMGYSAFSADRIDGITGVGSFTTEDIFGNTITESVFEEYDLTLVNVFATWCSPCVQEMPELEKLRQQYAEKNIRLGVVAIVLDAKTQNGLDEDAISLAKTLYERSGAQFPFLIPDEGNLNGRLTGIESIPESFFVNAKGEIISEAYVGANDLSGWTSIVDAELAKLDGLGE